MFTAQDYKAASEAIRAGLPSLAQISDSLQSVRQRMNCMAPTPKDVARNFAVATKLLRDRKA
jgi:hypothetical protein